MGRTFAIGDIHGDLDALERLLARLPPLAAEDTLLFVGDYVDRGPASAQVVALVRGLHARTPARVVALRGNHEDAWVRVARGGGWPEFVLPRSNGCYEAYRSFRGEPTPAAADAPTTAEMADMLSGAFIPPDVLDWMESLPHFHEDDHAIYVHAGLKRPAPGAPFAHPRDVDPQRALLWLRDRDFFEHYDGKLVVFGHTQTPMLPTELSTYTVDDPSDLWAGPRAAGIDTGAGKGGFLTALELPARRVYESR
ncbi:MAG TPA: metallophosphoesterase family protein [Kofleriaceae bacterium]|nr:metallophosphoesterase family protein [Kofleriaceae bacterium]